MTTYPYFDAGAANDIAPPSGYPYTDPDYASLVVNHANMAEFWMAYSDKLTMDGSLRVSAIATEKASGGNTITIHSVNANPLYVPGAYAGRPALEVARNVSGIPDTMRLPNGIPATGDFSIFFTLASTEGTPGTSRIMAGTSNSTGKLTFTALGAAIQMRVSNTPNEVTITWPVNIDWSAVLPHVFVGSIDRAAGTFGLSVDGGAFVTSTNVAATITNLAFAFGAKYDDSTNAGFNGRFYSWGMTDVALHKAGSATLWGNLRRQASDYLSLSHITLT